MPPRRSADRNKNTLSYQQWAIRVPDEAIALRDRYKKALIREARIDPNTFIEYVIRDDLTGKRLVQAPYHEELQQLITDNDRVLIWGHVESGKTVNLAIGRTLYEIGRNPNIRAAVFSSREEQAVKIVSAVATYIRESPECAEVFPHLRPGSKWSTRAFNVVRQTKARDYTFEAFPIGGKATGTRIDWLVLDDVLTWDFALSKAKRRWLLDWFFSSSVMGRLSTNARVMLLGNAYHPDDLMHTVEKLDGWVAKRYPVLDEHGKPAWPDTWPEERIEKRRAEIPPDEFARQMMCLPIDETKARFRREAIDACLARGIGLNLVHNSRGLPGESFVVHGVDLGTRKKKGADWTVIFTLAVHANEDRQVLSIQRGQWDGRKIADMLLDTYDRFGGIFFVEDVAAQIFILDMLKAESAIPVHGFTTGKNKHHPEFGVEAMAAEFVAGKWIIPSQLKKPADPEIAEWISEMIFYEPTAHTGDRLMASWFAREAARLSGRPATKLDYGQGRPKPHRDRLRGLPWKRV